MEKVYIFDSTLRDGAQAEGISYSVQDKLKIVESLDELGIDYIEAGNPSSNVKDLEFFKEVNQLKLNHSKIVAFGSTRRCNILPEEDSNLQSLLSANTEVIAIFGKSWDFHVTEILKTTLEENLSMISSSIKFLVKNGKKVFFDAEHFFDGYKHNPVYALKTIQTAEEAGASSVVLCDTNGGCFPDEIATIVSEVRKKTKIEIGIHTHNDTGQAVASTIMAVMNGVRQIQGTIIGIGERCGNANLSTTIANLELKKGYQCLPNGNIQLLKSICVRIAEISNLALDKTMPYVGDSAFAHKAGMHIDGVLKSSSSFEHVDPELIGNSRRFLLSEVAGRGTILRKLKKIKPDITKDDPLVLDMVNKVKELEYQGYQFEGADACFELLALKAMGLYQSFFKLESFKVIGDTTNKSCLSTSTAMIKISVDGKTEITAAEGKGPVNALDKALRKALEVFYPEVKDIRLVDYKVRILNTNSGTSATTRVLISSSDGKNIWNTVGVSEDIIEASWIALVDSIEYKLNKTKRQGD